MYLLAYSKYNIRTDTQCQWQLLKLLNTLPTKTFITTFKKKKIKKKKGNNEITLSTYLQFSEQQAELGLR